jgi:hypothetical protein
MLGLQFHLETTPQSAAALIDNCRPELDNSAYVQDPAAMLTDWQRFQHINRIMEKVLDALTHRGPPAI